MALTYTEVGTPNSSRTEFPLGHMKARIVDITFDSSYPTTGEVITAAALGWIQLYGAMPMGLAVNSAGTSAIPVQFEPSADKKQMVAQLYGYDGASAGKANLEVKANTFDASTFTVRAMVFGI
jgi:hypothetical protein